MSKDLIPQEGQVSSITEHLNSIEDCVSGCSCEASKALDKLIYFIDHIEQGFPSDRDQASDEEVGTPIEQGSDDEGCNKSCPHRPVAVDMAKRVFELEKDFSASLGEGRFYENLFTLVSFAFFLTAGFAAFNWTYSSSLESRLNDLSNRTTRSSKGIRNQIESRMSRLTSTAMEMQKPRSHFDEDFCCKLCAEVDQTLVAMQLHYAEIFEMNLLIKDDQLKLLRREAIKLRENVIPVVESLCISHYHCLHNNDYERTISMVCESLLSDNKSSSGVHPMLRKHQKQSAIKYGQSKKSVERRIEVQTKPLMPQNTTKCRPAPKTSPRTTEQTKRPKVGLNNLNPIKLIPMDPEVRVVSPFDPLSSLSAHHGVNSTSNLFINQMPAGHKRLEVTPPGRWSTLLPGKPQFDMIEPRDIFLIRRSCPKGCKEHTSCVTQYMEKNLRNR